MKKLFRYTVLGSLLLLLGTAAEESNPFLEFESRVAKIDNKIVANDLVNEDVLAWWKCTDEMILHFFNDILKGESPENRFMGREITPNFGYKLTDETYFSTDRDGTFGLSYYAGQPPDNHYAPLSVNITPLDSKGSLYFLRYDRLWWGSEQNLVGASGLVTFRILQKIPGDKGYQITAKLEETNLFRNVIKKKKFKYSDGRYIPDYGWIFYLHRDTIKTSGSKITFDMEFDTSEPGNWYAKGEMIVAWEYDVNSRKLKADYCIYKPGSDNDPNIKLFPGFKDGREVPIPP